MYETDKYEKITVPLTSGDMFVLGFAKRTFEELQEENPKVFKKLVKIGDSLIKEFEKNDIGVRGAFAFTYMFLYYLGEQIMDQIGDIQVLRSEERT